MIEISEQIQKIGTRFIKVGQDKAPIEKEWNKIPGGKNYSLEDEEIKNWLKTELMYGIITGINDLIVIDCDREELEKAIETGLPKTFRVKTGRGLSHFYFFCKELDKLIAIQQIEKGKNKKEDKITRFGELRSNGQMVIGPGSIHPNGKKYDIIDDSEIATVTKEQVLTVLEPFLTLKYIEETEKKEENMTKKLGIFELDITKVVDISKMTPRGNGEYFGSHPVHGSESGQNFHISLNNNLWRCWRCSSGGTTLHLIAVMEGILNCSEAGKGSLTGENFIKTCRIAKEKYHLPIELPEFLEYEFETKSLKNLLDNQAALHQEFVIYLIIPKTTIILFIGKPDSFKSMLALILGLFISEGRDFCGMKCQKARVLYLDAENDDSVISSRVQYLNKQYGFNKENNNFQWRCAYITDIEKVLKIADSFDVIIIDSLRRFLKGKENDSETINLLYGQFLKILRNKGKTLIIIHHDRKKNPNIDADDLMERARGSSDILAMADISFCIEKTEEKLEGKVLKIYVKVRKGKNRLGLQLSDMSFEVIKDDNEMKTTIEKKENVIILTLEERVKTAILNILADNQLHKTAELKENIKECSEKTISNCIGSLLITGSIISPKKGFYKLSDDKIRDAVIPGLADV
ncbi:MAG: AAA family ATPase [Candidatus Aenigmarchaeota archaeon]|nr:AAA family ATPase [Candidatus Aenigmarchaeota archaeon]